MKYYSKGIVDIYQMICIIEEKCWNKLSSTEWPTIANRRLVNGQILIGSLFALLNDLAYNASSQTKSSNKKKKNKQENQSSNEGCINNLNRRIMASRKAFVDGRPVDNYAKHSRRIEVQRKILISGAVFLDWHLFLVYGSYNGNFVNIYLNWTSRL